MPGARSPGPDPERGNSLQFRLETASPEETEAVGRRLGSLLGAGDVVALSGDLGAGKTMLARGIAAGAGAAGYIASPTFTFIREYRGAVSVYHVDLYRLEHTHELEDLGLDEVLDGTGLVVLEWAEKAGPLLPADHLWITIRFANGDETRLLEFAPKGPRYDEIVRMLGRELAKAEARKRGSAEMGTA